MLCMLLEWSLLTHKYWVGVVIDHYRISRVGEVGICVGEWDSIWLVTPVALKFPQLWHSYITLRQDSTFVPPSLAIIRYVGHSQPMMSSYSFLYYAHPSLKCCPPRAPFASVIHCRFIILSCDVVHFINEVSIVYGMCRCTWSCKS
jgi:hypothetical protein